MRTGRPQTRREFLRTALAASGVLAAGRLRAAAAPPTPGGAVRAQPLAQLSDAALEPDVCIVGSGPAGAILATTLVGRGISTLLIESGPGRDAAPLPNLASLDAYLSPGELRYPVQSTRFRGAGGTSNLWTGVCPRFHPIDFELNAYTPRGAPWPIRYGELEPFYERAEEELRVRGVSDTPFAPPRRAPFPRPLSVSIPNLERLAQGAASPPVLQHLPYSDWHGEPMRMAVSHLPSFSASPHGTLVCGATATRILCDDTGKTTGIRLQSQTSPARTVRAKVYVIACGGIETARLLLLSRSPQFPAGPGNHADLVGRCFMEHPSVVVGRATVRGLWHPWSYNERACSEQFLADAKQRGLGGVRLRWLATRAGLGIDLSQPWLSLRHSARALRVLDVTLRAEIEMEPASANRVVLTDDVTDAFGDPGASLVLGFTENDRRTIAYAEELVRRALANVGADDVNIEHLAPVWNHHHMGTCRMGDDPQTSVVDRNLRVHGVDNLYVAGSAPFVTGSVSNPTLTIAALSIRLADHLTERLGT